MKYISSRDVDKQVDGAEGIVAGISKDGGLFVPQDLPSLTSLTDLVDKDYRQLALHILEGFFPDLGREGLEDAVAKAYDEKFTEEKIVGLKTINDLSFLELYHGPTLAFKDMALSILPHLMKLAQDKRGIEEEIVILTATSGDTGKAALEGFAGVEGVKIVVFYPQDGVSQIQRLQMTTQKGDNTLVVGIEGNFDHAQSGVKDIFNNEDFKKELGRKNYILSSANSINIGRLVPQIAYYVYAYMEMVRRQEISLGEEINIVVPTGNFGNILAAYYGKEMGLPINKLICASNDNKVLTEFFSKGQYDINKELILSSSPSMDILISSNLERLLFHLNQDNPGLVRDKMEDLAEKGYYEIADLASQDFYANYSNEEDVSRAIEEVFREEDYLMDPHTAVAYGVYKKYREEIQDPRKTLIAATASPFKFGSKVASSIGIEIDDMDEFQILEKLSEKSGLDIPDKIRNLREEEIRHKSLIDKGDMKNIIGKFLGVGDNHDKS